jgi:hypothetical protein
VVERYLWSPKKNCAPSNRRAKGRLWHEQGSDECLHRVQWYKRVHPERPRETYAVMENRELRDPTEQNHGRPGKGRDPPA